MSSGVCRGKEFSNRIELSRLVQDLLNFGVLGSLQLWGAGIWGHQGCPHMHTHVHICIHIHVSMYRNYKWPPKWRYPCLSCLTCICVCTCMCAWDSPHTPIPTPIPIHPFATPRGTLGISKNSITLVLIKIFQFHLKI